MKSLFVLVAAFAALCVAPSLALAEDEPVSAPRLPRAETPAPPVLVFGDGAARFHVQRDVTAGRMTFRLADPAVRIDQAPVVLMNTESGPREVALTAVEGQPGTWVWTGDAVKAARFDGTMRVAVAGKAYTSPLSTVWTTTAPGADVVTYKPRYGGRVLTLSDCGASVEVLQDPATGTITVYSFEDVVVTSAPVITVTHKSGPTTVTLTPVEGRSGAWVAKHDTFKTTTTSSARIRLLVNGQPCEAPLVYATRPGGRIVSVSGGPSFEVVPDAQHRHYTFYPVEETWDGRPYVVENPTYVWNGRTYQMTRVEDDPRAWRLVGLDAAGSDARNGQLNFTLFGKTLSTRLGLSGFGIGVR